MSGESMNSGKIHTIHVKFMSKFMVIHRKWIFSDMGALCLDTDLI